MDGQHGNWWYVLPRTPAGWWAVALCAAFFISVSVTITSDLDLTIGELNVFGAFNFVLAIAGGVLALYAMLRRGERSLVLLAPVLPALFAVGFELAESL